MKKMSRWLMACVTLAGVLAGSQAFAGSKWGPSLVYMTDNSAQGSLTDVRNSADETQYIGCQVTAGPTSTSVFCYARSGQGIVRACSSSSPTLVAVANTIEPGTYLHFSFDSSGACAEIQASHASGFAF